MFGQEQAGLHGLLNRSRPTAWQLFLREPCVFLADKLYMWRRLTTPSRYREGAVSVVCVSDTHNMQCPLPSGDILIHAGDLTQSGSLKELEATIAWLLEQPHRTKIAIAGNHDLLLDQDGDHEESRSRDERAQISWGDIIYLENGSTTVVCDNGRRLNIYGSPLSPRHGSWAFQYARKDNVWDGVVPDDTDILITHCPPRAHLDLGKLGCQFLLQELWRVRPKLQVFGHIHEGHGHEWVQFNTLQSAYERTVLMGGGMLNLLTVLWAFVASLFCSPLEASCQLVNASMVGGLRDDERRRPIAVYI